MGWDQWNFVHHCTLTEDFREIRDEELNTTPEWCPLH